MQSADPVPGIKPDMLEQAFEQQPFPEPCKLQRPCKAAQRIIYETLDTAGEPSSTLAHQQLCAMYDICLNYQLLSVGLEHQKSA